MRKPCFSSIAITWPSLTFETYLQEYKSFWSNLNGAVWTSFASLDNKTSKITKMWNNDPLLRKTRMRSIFNSRVPHRCKLYYTDRRYAWCTPIKIIQNNLIIKVHWRYNIFYFYWVMAFVCLSLFFKSLRQ